MRYQFREFFFTACVGKYSAACEQTSNVMVELAYANEGPSLLS